jgi:hypothetical protein
MPPSHSEGSLFSITYIVAEGNRRKIPSCIPAPGQTIEIPFSSLALPADPDQRPIPIKGYVFHVPFLRTP